MLGAYNLGLLVYFFSSLNTNRIPLYEFAHYLPNGMRYPRVGGRRERRFAGTNFQPRDLPENAATPTRRVHVVLGSSVFYDIAIN